MASRTHLADKMRAFTTAWVWESCIKVVIIIAVMMGSLPRHMKAGQSCLFATRKEFHLLLMEQ
jgi:hypothetical protein